MIITTMLRYTFEVYDTVHGMQRAPTPAPARCRWEVYDTVAVFGTWTITLVVTEAFTLRDTLGSSLKASRAGLWAEGSGCGSVEALACHWGFEERWDPRALIYVSCCQSVNSKDMDRMKGL